MTTVRQESKVTNRYGAAGNRGGAPSPPSLNSVRPDATDRPQSVRENIREPTAFEAVERSVTHPGGFLAARSNGQPPAGSGNGTQRHPCREHVLHALVVLVDHTAGLSRHHGGRIDDPRELQRVAKARRPEKLAHQVGSGSTKGILLNSASARIRR
jgi:hypothetical protein